MLRAAIAVLLVLSVSLPGCSNAAGGLESYSNPTKGYEFLYPKSWVSLDLSDSAGKVDAVFRDLVERTENLSVVINEVPEDQTLSGLGSPAEVGYRLLKTAIAPPDSNREAELISAQTRSGDAHDYYKLEYEVKLPGEELRHNLASVAVTRGKLFTLNLSTPQRRWENRKDQFETVVDSFSVY